MIRDNPRQILAIGRYHLHSASPPCSGAVVCLLAANHRLNQARSFGLIGSDTSTGNEPSTVFWAALYETLSTGSMLDGNLSLPFKHIPICGSHHSEQLLLEHNGVCVFDGRIVMLQS